MVQDCKILFCQNASSKLRIDNLAASIFGIYFLSLEYIIYPHPSKLYVGKTWHVAC